MTPVRRRGLTAVCLAVLGLAVVLGVVALGWAGDSPSERADATDPPSPTTPAREADPVLTPPGTELRVGETAVVDLAQGSRGSPVIAELTVLAIDRGAPEDGDFPDGKAPTYVRAEATLLRNEEARFFSPLDTVTAWKGPQAWQFRDDGVPRCQVKRFPPTAVSGETYRTCSVFLLRPDERIRYVAHGTFGAGARYSLLEGNGVTWRPAGAAATSTSAAPESPSRSPEPRRVRGIDASHHQGPIDWSAVSGAGIRFAYLKATEGSSFTDPRFVEHRRQALGAGVRVGGYHYYSLCSPPEPQAAHVVGVLGELDGPRHLPPAVDLELGGNCSPPPARDRLLDEVRTFLRVVEERTGRRPIVYLYPAFEEHYGFAADLSGRHRQWVRRLGESAPERDWWIWQYDDAGTVPGVDGPVDLNRMRR